MLAFARASIALPRLGPPADGRASLVDAKQESQPVSSLSADKPRRSRNYIFVILFLVACGLVYLNQRQPPVLNRDWPQGLAEKLEQARTENRPVLVFFMAHPPGEITRRMLDTTLRKRKNRDAITEGNFIRVRHELDESLDSELAIRYRIKRLPTMLTLAPNGSELNRREGFIGEVEFRSEFVSGEVIPKPVPARD
jgi:hypothetical protein